MILFPLHKHPYTHVHSDVSCTMCLPSVVAVVAGIGCVCILAHTPIYTLVIPLPREYLLYHDTVDAHVFQAPGKVEQVDPAQHHAENHEAQVL